MKNRLQQELDQLLRKSPEEQIEFDAQILAFQFLLRIDEAMEKKEMSKKQLAANVGTSPAFITQLFQGDRKPNWTILAKMQKVLGLEFKVFESRELEGYVDSRLAEYGRVRERFYSYEKARESVTNKSSLPEPDARKIDFALAT